jgi:hypothetical protein
MTAAITITKMRSVKIQGQTVFEFFVRNSGTDLLPSGNFQIREYLRDGTVKANLLMNPTSLHSGESTKLKHRITSFGSDKTTSFNLVSYQGYDGEGASVELPLNILVKKGFLSWKLMIAGM